MEEKLFTIEVCAAVMCVQCSDVHVSLILSAMKRVIISVPKRFAAKCRRARLPVQRMAEFALESIGETELFEDVAKNFKFLVAPRPHR
jgi:hypothetical protein